ncbi:beta-glucosidase family protein [Gluconacetobacter tumulisoli]|uniref:Glycosyl hydrolase n=1 Tax=Gluconacetobacter tumulisoli TaxID=1286189 RepID=A0A7W4K9W1_9PROT|nr:glycoside hydrolase family 3 C-terminal domain-containing protein [Gluconacetobacter tumulisoli]MBB2203028.1 glycosyl hydrolase [Gluconacetobacter tumulisoli]
MTVEDIADIADDRAALVELAARLTREEKIDLVSGRGLFSTAPIPRLGIPAIVMVDGPNGLRYVPDQITREDADLGAFLAAVRTGGEDEEAGASLLLGDSLPATCFPAASALANSWDVGLSFRMGAALATEARALGVSILLGPGINLRRCPLAGRGFEYYSEDPVLSGDMAAGMINGLQRNGVGASLKHLACNNAEAERTSMDSVVEPRALHELYLLGFERAIAASAPWTVMTSYNRLNGTHTSADPWLLRQVLRDRWGYGGTVVSDWHGIQDRPAALVAGNDLDMPHSAARKRRLRAALAGGQVPPQALDEACVNMLALVSRARAAARTHVPTPDFAAHHRLARHLAARSCVLLANRRGALPLAPVDGETLLVVGTGARSPQIQGAGSAVVRPRACDVPLDALRALAPPGVRLLHCPGWADDGTPDTARHAEALAAARGARSVVVFASTPPSVSGENADRRSLDLLAAHDALISELARTHDRVIVVLTHPDAVLLPWADDVAAILSAGYAGQGFGGAIADLLFGHANPSGKLSVTWPARIEDCPALPGFPGENGKHLYREGIFVGYRHYDRKRIAPLFPFGFGLSYTRFRYSDLVLDSAALAPGQDLAVHCTVTNTGTRAGHEICQLYLGRDASQRGTGPDHPDRALKSFSVVELAPGESRQVTFTLGPRDFAWFDVASNGWRVPDGMVTIEVGASSRDIRLSAPLRVTGDGTAARRLTLHTPPGIVLATDHARRLLVPWLAGQMTADDTAADALLERCGASFLGLYDTLSWSLGREPDEDGLIALLDRINHANGIVTDEGTA